MYGVVREFQAPLAVTHAARGRFGPSTTSLGVVFARKNSLDIYVVRANKDLARLELLQSTPLGANVTSMVALRRGGPGADYLCLGFDRMRVVLMAWDHDARTWTTEQLLNLGSLLGTKRCSPSSLARSLDPEDYGRPLLRGMVGDYGQPLIRTDALGRCIAVLAKAQNAIYVIPVRTDDDPSNAESRVVNCDDVFLIDLPTDYEAANIKDFAFLEGTFEPNIVILHEPKRTWSGRAAIQRNTCQLLNLSIDVRSKRHSKTWAMDSLPYDSERIEAVPESAGGGALLLSASVLMQVRHGACVAGLSLNCFGDAYSTELKGKYDTITASDTLVECDAARCRFLDFEERMTESSSAGTQCIALLSLKGGELYFLNVAVGSRNAITMKRAGSTVIASEIVPINERFFVLASRLSDSLLVEYQKIAEPEKPDAPQQSTASKRDRAPQQKSAPSKRKKRKRTAEEDAEYEMIYGVKPPQDSSDEESGDENGRKQSALELQDKDEGTRGVYDDDDELGWVFNSGAEGDALNVGGGDEGSWALKVKDTLTCFGPGADLAVGPSPDDVSNTKLEMVIAGGYAKNGCLAVVHQSIRPTHRTQFGLPGCEGAWTLLDPSVTKREKLDRDARNEAIGRQNAARRARNTKKHAARTRFVKDAVDELRKARRELKAAESIRESESPPQADSEATKTDGQQLSTDAVTVNGVEPEGRGADNKGVTNDNAGGTVKVRREGEDGNNDTVISKRRKSVNGEIACDAANGDVGLDPIENEILAQLQQQAESSFPLEPEESLEEGISEEGALHSYMLLSTSNSTTVLKTGVEIAEVLDDSADFVTDKKTLTAGNVFGSEAIVQVVPSGVKVLRNGKRECEYSIDGPASPIIFAQVSDPLVLLQTEDDRILVLEVRAKATDVDADTSGAVDSAMEGQDDLFDEYGMALPGTDMKSPTRLLKQGPKDDCDVPDRRKRVAYQDFSIALEYSRSRAENNDHVISSFLYKGALADEVARDGILCAEEHTGEDLTEAKRGPEEDPTDVKEASDDVDFTVSKQEVEVENPRVDDEDRMLYGDDGGDEEDLMLYGAGDASEEPKPGQSIVASDGTNCVHKPITQGEANGVFQTGSTGKRAPLTTSEKGVIELPAPAGNARTQSHLLVLSKASGTLEILSPTLAWSIILQSNAFFAAPSLVEDSPIRSEDDPDEVVSLAPAELVVGSVAMVELSGSALLPGLSTPILIAISRTGIPLIYRVFMSSSINGKPGARSRLAFHRITFRDRTAHILARSMTCAAPEEGSSENVDYGKRKRQTPVAHFRNIAGRGGVFVGGPCPFILFAERGYPRIHAISHAYAEGIPISREAYDVGHNMIAFTEFHNVKCPRGFVSVAKDGIVRIGELPPPSVMNYDAPTPMKKISLRCTPHKVAYHASSATYGVLASMPTLTTREERLARILQSLEKHDKRHYQHTAAQAEAETGDDRANRVPPLYEELHELRVYRPDTWELIKSHKLQKGEVGLAIANMRVDVYKPKTSTTAGSHINKKGDSGGETPFSASLKMRPKDMLVVGTGHLNGEDASSRGRLLLFEISRQEVYTETGGVFTAFQLQLIAEKELFSPVTAVASMEGYVIAGVGPQVSVYKLVGDEIVHLSFAFGQLYCTALASIKQYVVAADMCKSVSFMYFRDRNNSVNFLGKDYEHVTSYATEFLLENENMSIIVSDGKGNMQLMNYAHASVPESRGGKRLLINGGTQFGSRINKFVRVRAPDLIQDVQSGRITVKAGSHPLVFTTLDGGIGALVAVTEVEFRKLEELRGRLVDHPGVVRHAGVNPAEQTAFSPETSSTVLLEQRMLDSRAIFDMFSVSLLEQQMIARGAGTDLPGLARTVTCLDSVLSRF